MTTWMQLLAGLVLLSIGAAAAARAGRLLGVSPSLMSMLQSLLLR
jgi:hypothetical protein